MALTVKDLYETLKTVEQTCPDAMNALVCVKVDEPTLGPTAHEEATAVCFGFDWDAGKCFICTQKPVVRKNKQNDAREHEPIPNCISNVSNDILYLCPVCGAPLQKADANKHFCSVCGAKLNWSETVKSIAMEDVLRLRAAPTEDARKNLEREIFYTLAQKKAVSRQIIKSCPIRKEGRARGLGIPGLSTINGITRCFGYVSEDNKACSDCRRCPICQATAAALPSAN